MIWLRQDTEPLISNHLFSEVFKDYSFLFKVNMLKYLYRAFYDCLHHKWRGTVPTWDKLRAGKDRG